MGIFLDILSALSSSGSSSSDLHAGDIVYVIPYGCYGEILEIVGDEYHVELDDDDDECDPVEILKRTDLRKA